MEQVLQKILVKIAEKRYEANYSLNYGKSCKTMVQRNYGIKISFRLPEDHSSSVQLERRLSIALFLAYYCSVVKQSKPLAPPMLHA